VRLREAAVRVLVRDASGNGLNFGIVNLLERDDAEGSP
jgi:hypothetical protein